MFFASRISDSHEVRGLGLADPALVVLGPGVRLAVVLEQLGQRVELEGALRVLRADVSLRIRQMALSVPLRPLPLPGVELAAGLRAVEPGRIRRSADRQLDVPRRREREHERVQNLVLDFEGAVLLSAGELCDGFKFELGAVV